MPRDLGELRSFIGFCSYYHRLIKGFARIATPHHLTKISVPFYWDQECQKNFESRRLALVDAPVLKFPDPGCPYLLDYDASNVVVVAVLIGERWPGARCGILD